MAVPDHAASAETAPTPAAETGAYLLDPSVPDTSWFDGDVASLRARQARLFSWARGAPAAVASVREIEARGVPARLYRPRGDETGVLVWCHGGGWVIGDVDCYDDLARAIAAGSGCAILSVKYRRAPEHRYPAAADDCWAATRWACDTFARVAVGGDSAGGNLAAVGAHRARDERLALAMQLLVYPVTDWRPDSASYAEFAARYRRFAGIPQFGAETQDVIRDIWEQYVSSSRLPVSSLVVLRAMAPLSLAVSVRSTTARTTLLAGQEPAVMDGEGRLVGARRAGIGAVRWWLDDVGVETAAEVVHVDPDGATGCVDGRRDAMAEFGPRHRRVGDGFTVEGGCEPVVAWDDCEPGKHGRHLRGVRMALSHHH